MTQTVTAMFDSRAHAEEAISKLVTAGVTRSSIRLLPETASTYARKGASYDHHHDEGEFWGILKDLFMPDEDRYSYSEGLSRGGSMVSVTADDAQATRVMDVLEHAGAVDIGEREATWRKEGWPGFTAGIAGASGGTELKTSGNSASYANRRPDGEEVIPVVEERLNVGKRVTEHGRVRIRSYVVETPVQDRVALTSEHVHIDRRAVDRPATGKDDILFREQTIEAVEREEVPVVAKETRIVEEIGIRTNVEHRTETITDKVRHTKVEVEDGRPGQSKPGNGR